MRRSAFSPPSLQLPNVSLNWNCSGEHARIFVRQWSFVSDLRKESCMRTRRRVAMSQLAQSTPVPTTSLGKAASPPRQGDVVFGPSVDNSSDEHSLSGFADNKVSELIVALTDQARRLGDLYGIPLKDFQLNPASEPASSGDMSSLVWLLTPRDLVSLERYRGEWGLWFRANVGGLGARDPVTPITLREAPLAVRRKFLHRSEEFFNTYLQRVDEGLGESRQACEVGMRALQTLQTRLSAAVREPLPGEAPKRMATP